MLPTRTFAAGAWDDAAAALAAKIIAKTGARRSITLEVRNLSSLAESDVRDIQTALRAQLRARGTRVLRTQRPIPHVAVTLSENIRGYLWVAEIQRDAAQDIEMIEVTKPGPGNPGAPPGMMINKVPVYEQSAPILDFAMLDADVESPPRLLLLDTGSVSLLSRAGGKWTPERALPITRSQPWPRDPRGRIVVRADGTFEAYTPGTMCAGNLQPYFSMQCRDSDDPWPLDDGEPPRIAATFEAQKNFFDGGVSLDGGQTAKLSPFYSGVRVRSEDQSFQIFAGLDGRAQASAKGTEPVATLDDWGSDLTAVDSDCGWQIFTGRAGTQSGGEAIQAFAAGAGAPTEDSAPVEFPGPVTALWPHRNDRNASAVAHNPATGNYEAFTLSISCGR